MMLLTLGLMLVPFIPGLRSIPRWIPVHRLDLARLLPCAYGSTADALKPDASTWSGTAVVADSMGGGSRRRRSDGGPWRTRRRPSPGRLIDPAVVGEVLAPWDAAGRPTPDPDYARLHELGPAGVPPDGTMAASATAPARPCSGTTAGRRPERVLVASGHADWRERPSPAPAVHRLLMINPRRTPGSAGWRRVVHRPAGAVRPAPGDPGDHRRTCSTVMDGDTDSSWRLSASAARDGLIGRSCSASRPPTGRLSSNWCGDWDDGAGVLTHGRRESADAAAVTIATT